ncbi:hypothetical protein TRIUR3_02397 [Triticum urartu]|uniref:DUF2921 domain-containing protein n=1 Tax=Triticum urartu TaxID=4572 RepID=M7Z547_TRIUA|nr:hypothetical protein TRIUR3_02397 [Triticum urartu]
MARSQSSIVTKLPGIGSSWCAPGASGLWSTLMAPSTVSGVLSLTITRNRSSSGDKSEMMDDPHHDLCRSPEFNLLPCVAKLSVVLEGIYTETGDDGGCGERTLTTRAVHGKMMSTSTKSDDVYFDTVRLVSQFGGPYASYRFRHNRRSQLGAASFPCYVMTTMTTAAASRVDVLGNCTKTSLFCDILSANWNYDSIEEFCSELGPFVMNTTNRAFTDFAILMQALLCGTTSGLDGKAVVLVTAVLRAVPPWEDREMAVKRAGLSEMTLSAEGMWSASTGRLCMTPCLGTGTDKAACQHHVSITFPPRSPSPVTTS